MTGIRAMTKWMGAILALALAASLLLPTSPAAAQSVSALDQVRLTTVTELVDGFENYRAVQGSYPAIGGFRDEGRGSVYINSGNSASYGLGSVAETLNDADADVAESPRTPLRLWEVAAQPCNGRVAIMSGSDSIVTDPADAQWWSDNNCPTWYLNNGRPYFQLTAAVSGPTPLDAARLETVTELVAGFEHYRALQGSYPSQGGFRNEGRGSVYVNSGNSASYGTGSVVQILNTADADVAFSPRTPLRLWEVAAQPCNGRVAIMSGSDSIVTDPADAQWWSDNNCPTWYLNNGRPYFQLTQQVTQPTLDDIRVERADELIAAFEAHGSLNIQGGNNNSGNGSVYVTNGVHPSYTNGSVAEALNLTPGVNIDTNYPAELGQWEIAAARCDDQNGAGVRYAVFTGSDNLTTDPADAQWWADNGCNSWYVDYGNRPYFQLTRLIGD